MEGVRFLDQRGPALCAYCHDDLDADAATCPACGVVLHAECRTLVSRCPSIGCPGTAPPRATPPAPPVEAPPRVRVAPGVRPLPGTAALCLRELSTLDLVLTGAVLVALGAATVAVPLAGAPLASSACPAIGLLAVLAGTGVSVLRAARVAAGVRRLLVRDDAGRVYATVHRIPLGETKRSLPKYRFEVRLRPHRSGREGGEARIQPTREPPPVWLQSLPLRAPLRLHGELSTGAIVVLEGPRGELVPARVVDRGTGEPPARWAR